MQGRYDEPVKKTQPEERPIGFLERARLAKRSEQPSIQSDTIEKVNKTSQDLDTIQRENQEAKQRSSLERSRQKSEESIASFHQSNLSADK